MDINNYTEKNTSSQDLKIYYTGHQNCEPGHLYSGIRNQYLIHYIKSGTGILKIKGETYTLNEGEGFLCPADLKHYYCADSKNPWSYYWIGFRGIKANSYLQSINLTPDNPVYKCENQKQKSNILKCMQQLHHTSQKNSGRIFYLKSKLHLLFYHISQMKNIRETNYNQDNIKENYVKKAIQFISQNYSH